MKRKGSDREVRVGDYRIASNWAKETGCCCREHYGLDLAVAFVITLSLFRVGPTSFFG